MSLSKEKLAKWIYDNMVNDPFKYEYICSKVTVHDFKQLDNRLEVEYSFWDDLHSDSTNQNNFLFDIFLGKEYGVNFPRNFDLIKCKDTYIWPSSEDCEELRENLSDINEEIADIVSYSWDDKETHELIELYISDVDKKSFVEMLVNEYKANVSFPTFIPKCLIPHFEIILSEYNQSHHMLPGKI